MKKPPRQRYIIVEKWRDFQHYRKRSPVWIKNHLTLLRKDAYLNLTAPQRTTLHGIWLLYAATDGKVPESTTWLSRNLNLRVTKTTLEALNHAGFIGHVASERLAERYFAACLETEVEKETKTSPPHVANGAVVELDDYRRTA